jgi:hypothetical protein
MHAYDIRYTFGGLWLTQRRGDPARVYSYCIVTPSGNYKRIYKLEQRAYGEFYTHLPIDSFHSLLIPYTYILRLRVLDRDIPTQKSIHRHSTSNRLQSPKDTIVKEDVNFGYTIHLPGPVFTYLTEKSLIIALAHYPTALVQAQLSTLYEPAARPATIEQSLYYRRN